MDNWYKDAVRCDHNKTYFEVCDPTIPMWTSTFAVELITLLKKEVV